VVGLAVVAGRLAAAAGCAVGPAVAGWGMIVDAAWARATSVGLACCGQTEEESIRSREATTEVGLEIAQGLSTLQLKHQWEPWIKRGSGPCAGPGRRWWYG